MLIEDVNNFIFPPAVALRKQAKPPIDITANHGKKLPTSKLELQRDIMSVKRLKNLLDAPTFPEEVRMLQKLFMSADLAIPGPTSIDPSVKQPTGEASHFEVFKVSWQSRAN